MTVNPMEFFDIPLNGITDMYAAMGRALWACQLLEEALAYYICLLFDIQEGTAEDLAHRILADKRRKTLGQLVKEVTGKQEPTFKESLDARLRAFTEERNWLAHRIQQENHTDLYHRDRFARLLARLHAIKVEAQQLAKVFEAMLDEWYERQGLTQEELHQRMAQTIADWRRIEHPSGS